MDPCELWHLRRSVHRFVSRYGRFFWAARQQYGQQPNLPPGLDLLPADQRPAALARDEARRLARARLYFLDVAATDLAVRLGAAIRAAAHRAAVHAAGHPGVVASMGAAPPAPCGLLRWATGVAYTPEGGAPVIACHWGTVPEGTWLAWWADNEITSRSHPPGLREQYLAFTGPLFYEHAMLLGPVPGPAIPAPLPGAAGPPGAEASSDAARVYTLLGSWLLLAFPGLAVRTCHEPTSAEITANQRAGVTSSPVTCAAGPATPELAALMHALEAAGS